MTRPARPTHRGPAGVSTARWTWAAGFSLFLSLGPWMAPPAKADAAWTATARLSQALRLAGWAPAQLARPGLPDDALPAGIAFPDQFRADPAAGLAALQALETVARHEAGRPETVLLRGMELAHGRLDWRTDDGPPASADTAESTMAASQAMPSDMPQALRQDLAPMLLAIARAQAWRRHALARWPASATAEALRRRFVPGATAGAEDRDTAPPTAGLLASVDHPALAHGLWQLAAAVGALQRHLAAHPLPPKTWRFETAWGTVLVDGSDQCNHYRGPPPLLLVDAGGNDTYAFDERQEPGIAIVLDLAGDDIHQASGAVLGYAVLWDAAGDDRYEAGWLAQGAALFGGALVFDGGGDDRYLAQGMAQGFALGGVAVLVDASGNDRYEALTQSQASAGPGGFALLLDASGDDRYLLRPTPLVLPSAQLPQRNASLGQGSAFGLRPAAADDPGTAPGGLAILLDLAGDDRYAAEVFAQGSGYERGLGVLMDGGGHDRMQAAWYAMGAAAHQAGGVLVARDGGRYAVEQSTALGAAHDDSVALFIGGVGAARHRLGGLGFGAAHDGGSAVFIGPAGRNNGYALGPPPCHAFGAGARSDADTAQPANTALFVDPQGRGDYAADCVGLPAGRGPGGMPLVRAHRDAPPP